jgi:Patatin-like phospholipase
MPASPELKGLPRTQVGNKVHQVPIAGAGQTVWRMPPSRMRALLFVLLGALCGCSSLNAYSNAQLPIACSDAQPSSEPAAGPDSRPLHPIWAKSPGCFQPARPWGPDVVAMTLSGGGSRAAVFGTAVMLELQEIGVLDSVDLVSSVSGGSVAAALYALSRDPDKPGADSRQDDRKWIAWDRPTVIGMIDKNSINPWIWRSFRPDNWFKYWFTAYDRTDMLADTLNSQVFAGLGENRRYPTSAIRIRIGRH